MEDEVRVDKLFMKLFGRVARDGERLSCISHIDQYQKALAESDVPAEMHLTTSWQSLCRALLASNEFIYLDWCKNEKIKKQKLSSIHTSI